MNRLKIIPALSALLLCLTLTPSIPACPSCQAALDSANQSEANTIEQEKAKNLATAFNQSIYLMVSVPYLLLGFFGLLIYRGMKKNEAFRKTLAEQEARKQFSEESKPDEV
jgi:hypothetical protein